MKVVLTGGGTAGHVTPNLAIIPLLQEAGCEIHYIGSQTGLENKIVKDVEGLQFHSVPTGKLRRYFSFKTFPDMCNVVKGVSEAKKLIAEIKPDVVFSKGGYVGVPVVYGAALNKVPVIIHESDMTSGLANKLCMPVAKKLLCTFPETAEKAGEKGMYVGAPIRSELLMGSCERGLKAFGFTDSKPVLVVTGGSQGSQAINRAVREALDKLLPCFQVLHITGDGNLDARFESYPGYVQEAFLKEELSDALAMADVVISRAGSNTICELRALRKPMLLIPYPAEDSRGDQVDNAESFRKRGFAKVLEQKDMTAETLVKQVIETYKDRGELISAMRREPIGRSVELIVEQILACSKK